MLKKTYFISDCHLGATYITDPRAHQKRMVEWLNSISSDAGRLFLLGDIIDYWFEYRYVVPRGYTRFFGALAALADRGVEITWVRGNHDIWLFDYLQNEIGITVADNVIERTIDGKKFVMAHGDGIGRQSLAFSFIRSMFRNRFLQKLYASVHPRWTVGFAHSWSSHNRMHGNPETTEILQPGDRYVVFAENYQATHPRADFFVFGHRHIAIDQQGPEGSRIIILGDAFSKFTCGEFDGTAFKLHPF